MKSFVVRSFLRATLGKLFAESIPDFVKCIGPTTFCWFPIVSYVCADHNPANYEVYVSTNIQAEVKVLVPCFRNGFLFPSVPQHNCLALVMIQDSLRSYVSRSLFHATMLCVWTDRRRYNALYCAAMLFWWLYWHIRHMRSVWTHMIEACNALCCNPISNDISQTHFVLAFSLIRHGCIPRTC
jgi:hypothetical protein